MERLPLLHSGTLESQSGDGDDEKMKSPLSLLSFSFAWVLTSAFFSANTSDSRSASQLYPSAFPDSIFTPWVWDAHYESTSNVVEIVLVSRTACYFNHTKWNIVIDRFPSYSKSLGSGLVSNILVNPQEALFRKLEGLVCHFYHKNSSLPVAKTKSEIIRGRKVFLIIGSILVVCPSPNVEYDRMRLERELTTADLGPFTDSLSNVLQTNVSSTFTDAFPVTNIPEFNSVEGITTKKIKPPARYGLSVCTATGRTDRAYLVEWIEHHVYLGVSRFYIYSTADHGTLLEVLSDYIREGVVVVISWMYENCVKGMASGRYVIYTDPTEGLVAFRPPRAIAHTAALASCYSRFRKKSRYMMHIDDDEFVALSPILMQPNGSKETRGPLVKYASRMFRENPKAHSIVIAPMHKHLCSGMGPKNEISTNASNSNYQLPRVGKWQFCLPGHPAEGKLIMKTRSVRMFFVHYVSQTEDGTPTFESTPARRSEAALLHYKQAREDSGDPFGLTSLEYVNKGNMSADCNLMKWLGGLHEGTLNGFYHHTVEKAPEGFKGLGKNYMVQAIDTKTKDHLRERFAARMGSHLNP